MKVGIVGIGHLGSWIKESFEKNPKVTVFSYDGPKGIGSKDEINKCDVSFVCVPTPDLENGDCNTSIVEEVISWLDTPLIVIGSTIKIGTVDKLAEKYPNKNIVFSPEYYGETANHPIAGKSFLQQDFFIFGGDKKSTLKASEFIRKFINPTQRIITCSAKEAEFAKYVENSSFAVKRIWCSELEDLAEKLGINYDSSAFNLFFDLDKRVTPWHARGGPRGYGGTCLPKDSKALLFKAKELGVEMELLETTIKKNEKYKGVSLHDLHPTS